MSCPGTPAVVFDYAGWQAMFPELAAVSQQAAQGFFNRATLICANKLGPVPTLNDLTILLNLLTAHLAKIYSPAAGGGSGLVGRISGATEGSVSVQTENQYPPGSAQWFMMSVYGAEYWAATAVYRTFHYRPGRQGLAPSFSFLWNGGPWVYPQGVC